MNNYIEKCVSEENMFWEKKENVVEMLDLI